MKDSKTQDSAPRYGPACPAVGAHPAWPAQLPPGIGAGGELSRAVFLFFCCGPVGFSGEARETRFAGDWREQGGER